MSSNKLWQICHKQMITNQDVTKELVAELRHRNFPTKQLARELNVPTERIRNWYYKSTGMTALDLILLEQQYDFIEKAKKNIRIKYNLGQ